jgi:hypothetical protein
MRESRKVVITFPQYGESDDIMEALALLCFESSTHPKHYAYEIIETWIRDNRGWVLECLWGRGWF